MRSLPPLRGSDLAPALTHPRPQWDEKLGKLRTKKAIANARSDAPKVETVSLLAKTRAAVAGAPLASASFGSPQERGAEQTTSQAELKKSSGSSYLADVPETAKKGKGGGKSNGGKKRSQRT